MIDTLIGIDFGTSYTVISLFNNNKIDIISEFPSKVGYYNNKYYCGNDIPNECHNIIHSFKLDIGTNNNNDILDIFFRYIVDKIKYDNINAVITVPSHFYDNQRNIIKFKFESLGINILRILNEPTAAAIAYGLNYSLKDDENILVIDIGGGTSDFTVLSKSDNLFEIVHSYGINNLGGNNFTFLLMNHFNILWEHAEYIKKELSQNEIVKINDDINISQNYFNKLIISLINKLKITLTNIKNLYDINYILLVGGTNKIPIIQTTIQDIFNIKPWLYPHIEYAVSNGACLYAGILTNKYTLSQDILVLDILSLSLGVELADGTYSIIVPKNTPLPTKMSQKYTTDTPDSDIIKIKLYQGERNIAKNNYLIKEIEITKDKIDFNPIIEIEYKIDVNSIITINIINKKNGDNKTITINNINYNDNYIDDFEEMQRIQLIYNISNISNTKYDFNTMNNLQLLSLLNKLQDSNLESNDLDYNLEYTNLNSNLDSNLDSNLEDTINYKDELLTLINYLDTEINNENIINNKLKLLLDNIKQFINDNDTNDDNTFWKKYIDDFNDNCSEIY
jgi:molecular chaperone DnaK